MMVIVGASSLLGVHLISKLNQENFNYLVLVDEDSPSFEWKSKYQPHYWHRLDQISLLPWLTENQEEIECLINCQPNRSGPNHELFGQMWYFCAQHQIPFIFSNSDQSIVTWARRQSSQPFFWAELSVSLMYGPGEEHFTHETSVVHQLIQQQVKKVKNPLEQIDSKATYSFTYVPDVVEVIYFLIRQRQSSGSYSIPRQSTDHRAIQHWVQYAIENDTPPPPSWPNESRLAAEFLTENGFTRPFQSLPEGVFLTVKNYLANHQYI